MATCNCSIYQCSIFIFFFEFFNIAFLICLTVLFKVSLKDNTIKEIKNVIYPETPIYDLTFFYNVQQANYMEIPSFYIYGGRTSHTGTKNISKIYNKKFSYIKDERSFFEYNKDYSVGAGENCKDSYKKCGILNTEGRILCLPNNEECPLNDFVIAHINKDSDYNEYEKEELTDFDGSKHYFYFTNKKTDKPIVVDFKLSYGLPCMSPSEKSWKSIFTDDIEMDPICKTTINGKLTDDRYINVGGGISIKSLYKSNSISITEATGDDYVNLYTRNFIYSSDKCLNDFFSLISRANSAETAIRVLGSISLLLALAYAIYAIVIRCCRVKFYIFFLGSPIFGIIFNLIALILSYTIKYKYECDDLKDEINKRVENELSLNIYQNLVYFIMSLVFNIILFLMSLCMLKLKMKKLVSNIYPSIPMGMNGQPVYIQQMPLNYNGYTYQIPYSNFPQNNNVMYQNPNRMQNNMLYNMNFNAPPPSSSPLEKK